MPRYDRAAAANYVWKYGFHYNPSFANYGNAAGVGEGDCTNFVSQALYAGGWTMKYGMAHSPNSWWTKLEGQPTGSWYEHYIHGYASNTWVGAGWFGKFLAASPRVYKCQESNLQVGDIVQVKNTAANVIDHTMIVTTKRYDDVGVSYHTRDVLDASLKEVKKRFGLDTEMMCWKVADFFLDDVGVVTGAGGLSAGQKS